MDLIDSFIDRYYGMLEAPSRETYMGCHARLASLPGYDPYSSDINQADTLCREGDFRAAGELIFAGMRSGNLLLSPGAHLTLGWVFKELGDEERSMQERVTGLHCVQAIASTGDGSENAPFVVARTSDEYDMLGYLQSTMVRQSLHHKDDRSFDLIECEDGAALWFDITLPFSKLSAQFERGD